MKRLFRKSFASRDIITLSDFIGSYLPATDVPFHFTKLEQHRSSVLVGFKRRILAVWKKQDAPLLRELAYVKQLLINSSCNSSIFYSLLIHANTFSYLLLFMLIHPVRAEQTDIALKSVSLNTGLLPWRLSRRRALLISWWWWQVTRPPVCAVVPHWVK